MSSITKTNPSAITEQDASALAERLVTAGDLASLTAVERVKYYLAMCDRCQLDPLSRPFDYIKTFEGGKEKIALYPNQIAAAQLRRLHKVSLRIVERRSEEGLYVVIAEASTVDGRRVESTGAVPMIDKDGKQLSAMARCNNIKKAETQAYRRATIAICGLDFSGVDEDGGQLMKSEFFDPPLDAIDITMPVQPARLGGDGSSFRDRLKAIRKFTGHEDDSIKALCDDININLSDTIRDFAAFFALLQALLIDWGRKFPAWEKDGDCKSSFILLLSEFSEDPNESGLESDRRLMQDWQNKIEAKLAAKEIS